MKRCPCIQEFGYKLRVFIHILIIFDQVERYIAIWRRDRPWNPQECCDRRMGIWRGSIRWHLRWRSRLDRENPHQGERVSWNLTKACWYRWQCTVHFATFGLTIWLFFCTFDIVKLCHTVGNRLGLKSLAEDTFSYVNIFEKVPIQIHENKIRTICLWLVINKLK